MNRFHFERLQKIADEVYERLNPQKKTVKKESIAIDIFIGMEIHELTKLHIKKKYTDSQISYAVLQVLKQKKRDNDEVDLLHHLSL